MPAGEVLQPVENLFKNVTCCHASLMLLLTAKYSLPQYGMSEIVEIRHNAERQCHKFYVKEVGHFKLFLINKNNMITLKISQKSSMDVSYVPLEHLILPLS